VTIELNGAADFDPGYVIGGDEIRGVTDAVVTRLSDHW
jgi:hypothetical protein